VLSPDHPTKLGSHRSNLPAVGREVLDCEGFFIPWPKPEPSGNRKCSYILLKHLGTSNNFQFVTLAKAGVQ